MNHEGLRRTAARVQLLQTVECNLGLAPDDTAVVDPSR